MSLNEANVLSFLGLPPTYDPSPVQEPISFLSKHILQLPQHLALTFSATTTPKQRTTIPVVRNRRLEYANSSPKELRFDRARQRWPTLWTGTERRGIEEGDEEKQWAESGFMEGGRTHVKKLGRLLGQYEEEREAERVRQIRREMRQAEEFMPEEDSESEDDDDEDFEGPVGTENESVEEQKMLFERRIQEKFIYGLLDNIDYDSVDFNENLDRDIDRDLEERWFDEEEDE